MASTKISALADVVTLASGDKVPVADASDLTATKSATMTEIGAYILPLAYPVGSIYISVSSTNPATSLGFGTWSAFGAGKVLVGLDSGDTDFDTVEETGGSKTSSAVMNHTHTVNVTDPGHDHLLQGYPTATGASSGYTRDTSMSGTPADSTLSTKANTTGITATTDNPAGGVASFSLMNPYIVVYMFKRTA